MGLFLFLHYYWTHRMVMLSGEVELWFVYSLRVSGNNSSTYTLSLYFTLASFWKTTTISWFQTRKVDSKGINVHFIIKLRKFEHVKVDTLSWWQATVQKKGLNNKNNLKLVTYTFKMASLAGWIWLTNWVIQYCRDRKRILIK